MDQIYRKVNYISQLIEIITVFIYTKIEVPMDVRYSKSGDITSSGKNALNIRTKASPKMGQDQVSFLINLIN